MTLIIQKPTGSKLSLAKEFTVQDYMWNFPQQYGLWSPAEITTALWLDAADASTITESGGAVSQWDDKSGNSRHAVQATASNQPVYTASSLINNKPAIDFTTNRATTLITPTIPNNTVFSSLPIFVLGVFYNRYSASSFQSPVGARPGGGSWWTFLRPIGGTEMEIGFHGSSQKWSGVYSTNQSALISWSVNSASLLDIYLNGVFIYSSFPGAFTTALDSPLSIGAGSSTASFEDYEGLIGEIIFLTSEISVSNRQKLEGYLAHKWGLTANLPSDHPYKLVGPTP